VLAHATDGSPVEIISFGYGHGPAPEAHAIFDVRHHFKDPHVNPALRYLTAADAEVIDAVMETPGIPGLIDAIAAMARSFRDGPRPGAITIAVGCVGGRHRSAAIAMTAARLLQDDGVPVTLTHRDLNRPVISR
jgi:UPF0042 nucleotide-binding protein